MSLPDMPNNNDQLLNSNTQLSFLSGENWLTDLSARLDAESVSFYQEKLQDAAPGLGYCIDERPINDQDPAKNLLPKPAFVGGAAGWVVMFLLQGKSLPQAIDLTKQLYEKTNWGEMEIHTDTHSYEDQVGCGFLNVQQKVIETLQELKLPGVVKPTDQNSGVKIFETLKIQGAKVITLTGGHKAQEAKVVINQVKGKTLNRQELYDHNPAFLWDAWATANEQVTDSFNQLAGTSLETEDFFRLQAGLHLATGTFLNAVRLQSPGKNIVLLS